MIKNRINPQVQRLILFAIIFTLIYVNFKIPPFTEISGEVDRIGDKIEYYFRKKKR